MSKNNIILAPLILSIIRVVTIVWAIVEGYIFLWHFFWDNIESAQSAAIRGMIALLLYFISTCAIVAKYNYILQDYKEKQ